MIAKWRARFMVVILSQSLATSDRTLFRLDAAFFRDFEPARDFGTVERIVLLGRVADGIDAVFDEELLAGGQAHRLRHRRIQPADDRTRQSGRPHEAEPAGNVEAGHS